MNTTKFLFPALILVLLTSCTSRSGDKPYLGTWIQLTKQNNEYIIFKPCAGDNRLMRVSEQQVYELLPSEENKSPLQNITAQNDGYMLNGKSGSHYSFAWQDKEKGVAVWKIAHAASDPEEQVVFVDSFHAHNFKTVKEKGCDGEISNQSGTVDELLQPMLSEYTVAETIKGDANNDGTEDQLVILHHKSESDPGWYESLVRNDTEGVNRDAVLFLGQPGGKFTLAFENKKMIPSKLFSQNEATASYDPPVINKGMIQFTTNEDPRGGAAILRKVKYTFSYSAVAKNWLLKEATISYIPYQQKADTHTLTAATLGAQSLERFNVYQFSPNKYVRNENNSFFMR